MRAEVIAVGSELLSLDRPETNSIYIASRLRSLGIRVLRKVVVGDRVSDIRESLLMALEKSEVVVLCGGLGPTNDDITREAVAETLGRKLTEDDQILEGLSKRYRRYGLRLSPNNRRQANVPQGAEVLPNPHGTAPGLFLQEGETLVFLLPGPPREMIPMIGDHVLPKIQRIKKVSTPFFRQLKVAGEAESSVDARIESIYKGYKDVETTILSSAGIISLYFLWEGASNGDMANRTLEELVGRVRNELGRSVFTDQEKSLAQTVAEELETRCKTLATAESCTGGLIGKMLTDEPGSSSFFLGGVVSYSNEMKQELLGVEGTTLEKYGAVSEPVALQMASGIRKRTRADIGLSVSGVAGPDGGTTEKPVGLVYLGLARQEGTEARRLKLPGDRRAIRLRAARAALDWVRRTLV